jgi:hypothetical protein
MPRKQDSLQVNDVEILSRPGDIRMFEKNIVWQDLVRVLRNEKEISAQEFDSVDPEDRLEIVRIQMRRQMIDFLIELPSLLAEQLGAEEEMT